MSTHNVAIDELPPLMQNTNLRFRTMPSDLEIPAGDTGPSMQAALADRLKTIPMLRKVPNGHPKKAAESTKIRSFLYRLKRQALKHTWIIPLFLLVAIISLYAANPTEHNPLHRFIFLSYRQQLSNEDVSPQYGKGPRDIAFVCFYTLVLSFTREFIMQRVLCPLARANGIVARGKQLRFMEQAYTALYFSIMGPLGLYVMRNHTPSWYFNTIAMYKSYPHRTHSALAKFYYLFQAAYWAQQAVVMALGMEERRKDYKELVMHHVVTLTLIGLSYRFHFTYVGIAVYITHDISDFFLAVSKSLHYLDSPLLAPFYFTNIITWIYLRHYLNLRILFSVLTDFKTVGPYQLDWETQQYKCWISNLVAFVLLAALQGLNLIWLSYLLRSAFRFVVYNVKKDDRSEDEGE